MELWVIITDLKADRVVTFVGTQKGCVPSLEQDPSCVYTMRLIHCLAILSGQTILVIMHSHIRFSGYGSQLGQSFSSEDTLLFRA